MNIQTVLNDIATYGPTVVTYLMAFIGLCAFLAANLPKTGADSSAWATFFRKLLDYVAQNYKNAKNMPSPPKVVK